MAEKAGASRETFEVSGALTGAFTVTAVRAMSSDQFPDVAIRFVGDSVRIPQTDTYEAPAADGCRTVRSDIEMAALSVSGRADQILRLQDGSTEVHVKCTVESNILFVCKQVAAAMEHYVSKALSLIAREAEDWLADR